MTAGFDYSMVLFENEAGIGVFGNFDKTNFGPTVTMCWTDFEFSAIIAGNNFAIAKSKEDNSYYILESPDKAPSKIDLSQLKDGNYQIKHVAVGATAVFALVEADEVFP